MASVKAYTEVIHWPVWTAKTSLLWDEAVARAKFRPIEPAVGHNAAVRMVQNQREHLTYPKDHTIQ